MYATLLHNILIFGIFFVLITMTNWNIQIIDNVAKLQKRLVLIFKKTLISGFLATIYQRILFFINKLIRFSTRISSRSDIKDYSKPAIQFERNTI